MQAADRRMRVPGAAGAVALEHLGELRGVFGQMLERHRAVLDEGDRLALVLHRHHHVEPGGADLADRCLQRRVHHLDHAAPARAGAAPVVAEVAHQLGEPQQPAEILAMIVLAELDEQDRLRIAAHHGIDRRLEHRDVARQAEHGAVDQFDGNRRELDDVLRRLHRALEAAEVAGADRAAAEQRRELELDLGGEAERAFGADQDMREVHVVAAGHERVEIVAADAALHLREARLDHLGLARADLHEVARQRLERGRDVGEIGRDRAEMQGAAVRQQRIDREHVLAGVAVAQRARAAGIVADHAADGGARGGRDVDRKPQAVRLELAVELVEHDAGLDHAAAAGDVELDHIVEIFRAVDDQRGVDGLAALRGAAAARRDRHALLPRDRNRPRRLVDAARRHHAHRHDLIVRGVGGVAAAAETVEHDLAGQFGFEAAFQAGSQQF